MFYLKLIATDIVNAFLKQTLYSYQNVCAYHSVSILKLIM